jgi:hypothetical protein
MGYYGLGGLGTRGSRIKWKIEPQKCFFCDEKRTQMLDLHRRQAKGGEGVENLVLLCPSHHREVHLGWKELSVNN